MELTKLLERIFIDLSKWRVRCCYVHRENCLPTHRRKVRLFEANVREDPNTLLKATTSIDAIRDLHQLALSRHRARLEDHHCSQLSPLPASQMSRRAALPPGTMDGCDHALSPNPYHCLTLLSQASGHDLGYA